MILLGQLAALGTAFCWSLTAVFFSYSGRLVGSEVVNRSRLLFAMLFITITHLVLVGTIFPFGAEPYRWGWLALSSILGLVLGDTFLFRAYVLVGPRLSMLMMSTVPILSTAMARVFLGERVAGIELAGIDLLLDIQHCPAAAAKQYSQPNLPACRFGRFVVGKIDIASDVHRTIR